MSERGSASCKIYRKRGHPQHSGGVQEWEQTEVSDTLNIFDNSENRTPLLICQVFDARGNGGGGTAPTITGDHQNRVTDYTAIVLQRMDDELLHRERTSESVIPTRHGRGAELHGRSAEDNRGGYDE